MMEALNISGSLKFTNKHNSCFTIRRRDILLPIATAGHPNANRNNNTLLTRSLISLHNNNNNNNNRIASFLPIISASRLSYHAQINDFQDDDDDQIQDLGSSTRKVNVKFQLQRECSYGDQFYLVGDDPMFGSWNPQNAVPLQWSEGHLWTANLDIAIGKTIQYKFLLKGGGGGGGCIEDHLTWQPGSDRVLTTWETSKRIVVCEDWDDVLIQKIMEEEDETMPLMQEEEEEEISNGAPEKEEVLIKETTAAAMEDVISRASSSYGAAKMVEEEPEVTTA